MHRAIDRDRLAALRADEADRFARAHPGSQQLATRAAGSLLGSVPMNWMACWPGQFPVFAAEASGARVVDVDGHEYVDFCLGDTGAMTGHSPPAAVAVIADRAKHGITFMLPTEDSLAVAEELAHRFVANAEHAAGGNLRWVAVHMIQETARPTGHVEIIRETIDRGRQ